MRECKAVLDIAFLVDSSGSISSTNLRKMKQFLKSIVNEFEVGPDGTHVAIVVYSNDPAVVLGFNGLLGSQLTTEAVETKIDAMPHLRGFTFIDKALKQARDQVFTKANGMRADVPKVLLMYTNTLKMTSTQVVEVPVRTTVLILELRKPGRSTNHKHTHANTTFLYGYFISTRYRQRSYSKIYPEPCITQSYNTYLLTKMLQRSKTNEMVVISVHLLAAKRFLISNVNSVYVTGLDGKIM